MTDCLRLKVSLWWLLVLTGTLRQAMPTSAQCPADFHVCSCNPSNGRVIVDCNAAAMNGVSIQVAMESMREIGLLGSVTQL